jgi:hypothetical protein
VTARTRTAANCLTAALAEPIFKPVPLPVDITDEMQFPEMALARAHLAAMSPERRAQLEREWKS